MARSLKSSIIFVLAAIVSILAQADLAHATTVVPFTVDELAQVAPIVVYGQIVEIEVDAKTGLRTAVLEASDVAKAPTDYQSQRDFLIPLYNRAIPHSQIVERVAASPEFNLHEDVVVFLQPIESGREGGRKRSDGKPIFALKGFHQGKLKVYEDDDHVRRVAAWNETQATLVTTQQLLTQATTARSTGPNANSTADLEVPAKSLRTLDGVLNKARAAASAGF